MSKKNYKSFTNLEKIVIGKLLDKIGNEDYEHIKASEDDLNYEFPDRMVTESKRKSKYLKGLSSQTLVFLATSSKADLELRAKSISVLFHKLNTEEDYPFSGLITKEEYISEAVIPELKGILNGLKIQLEIGGSNETDKSDGENTSGNNVAQTEVKEEECRGSNKNSNRGIKKPEIF